MGWPKGPHFGGKVPATFLMADGIEIFIDESGDFGSFDGRCPYYIVAMWNVDAKLRPCQIVSPC